MGSAVSRPVGVATAATLPVATLAGAAESPAAAHEHSPAYDRGYALGTESYRYGLPLVTTSRTFRNRTGVDVPNGHGYGPGNRLHPIRSVTKPSDRAMVAPKLDTLCSIGRPDLRKRPQVIHVPEVEDRSSVIPLMRPDAEDFASLPATTRSPSRRSAADDHRAR